MGRRSSRDVGGMWGVGGVARVCVIALGILQGVAALPPITVKGAKFFTSDGDQFYIKGVVYQPSTTGVNNLMDGPQCETDAALIKDLGANLIRVYSVDPTLNHDRCMKAFDDAGIYVLVDMTTPQFSFDRTDPSWTKDLRNAFAQVVDGFQKYDNVLGLIAGNEVVLDEDTTVAAPYVKAAIADMKAYRDAMRYREMPIGYSAADVQELRVPQQDYFDCGNASIAADFFGMNLYSWCGDSSFTESGYDKVYDQIDGYDIPIFLSETGCNTGDTGGRPFTDQVAVLGRQMNDRLSGNIIYEWTQEANNYGLVSYSNDQATGTPKLLADYTNLKSEWATLTPAGIEQSNYNPSLTKRDCPSSSSGVWSVGKNVGLPTLGIDGFQTPTGPRSSTVTQTGSQTGSQRQQGAQASDKTTSSPNSEPTSSGEPAASISAGAIAGIVLGALVVIALILGGILLLLRRRKKRLAEMDNHPSGSDKAVATNGSNDYYGPQYSELATQNNPQELDPSRGYVATMRANELEQHNRDHELHGGRHPQSPQHQSAQLAEAYKPVPQAPVSQAPEPSPYVQAQRKIEIDYLETEEARLRQRREALMGQDGGQQQ
ncbi:hypothetical protein EJ04DRAFT_549611 [Polyplosphaeria fusca]|uniref:1,3-beta-glucanosyltransferase n=1 Tax=Polyplosphaeria fusca TaxID=682080 RepID=A0A9P4R930_9PLEO|nr:hypothetical protein EJ04DRAFT_549611 [Polyplosphaeria fusca]